MIHCRKFSWIFSSLIPLSSNFIHDNSHMIHPFPIVTVPFLLLPVKMGIVNDKRLCFHFGKKTKMLSILTGFASRYFLLKFEYWVFLYRIFLGTIIIRTLTGLAIFHPQFCKQKGFDEQGGWFLIRFQTFENNIVPFAIRYQKFELGINFRQTINFSPVHKKNAVVTIYFSLFQH